MSLPKTELWSAGRQRSLVGKYPQRPSTETAGNRMLLGEDAFVSMLYLERRRAERADKRFVLMLVDVQRVIGDGRSARSTLGKITGALCSAVRETDIVGWYLEDQLIGVIGT